MKGIAVISEKGGGGKTSLSHALALGAAWHGVPAHFMHTDNRKPIKVQGRPYMYYDARDRKDLRTLVSKAINSDGLFIIDGGGNRPDFDEWIAESMDLALIPVTPDEEDVGLALDLYRRLEEYGAENVRFILNRYPKEESKRLKAAEDYKHLPLDKVIGALPICEPIKRLKREDIEPFKTPTTVVNKFSRALYKAVGEYIDKGKTDVSDIIRAA